MRFPEERQTLARRITVLRFAAYGLFGALAICFWFFQIIQHAKFQEMADNNHQRELPLRAPRGVLFDRNGRVLVENRPSFTVSIVSVTVAVSSYGPGQPSARASIRPYVNDVWPW